MLHVFGAKDNEARRLGGRPDGRATRGSCLTISAHLSDRGTGTAPPRWGGETLMQKDGAPSSAPLLPFLTFGPDLGAWPDCWVSVEFLHVPIPRMGSGRTTTTTMIQMLGDVLSDATFTCGWSIAELPFYPCALGSDYSRRISVGYGGQGGPCPLLLMCFSTSTRFVKTSQFSPTILVLCYTG